MQITSASGAAVLLAFAIRAVAIGSVQVVNNCGFDVYYASVAQTDSPAMALLPPNGFSDEYSLPDIGVSVKLATSLLGPPTQFEYTWSAPNINYDLSDINGQPFLNYGTEIKPSTGPSTEYPTCQTITCAPGENPCAAAYNSPNQVRTMVCGQDTSLVMTLCPSNTTATPPATDKRAGDSASPHRLHARHMPQLA